MRIVVADTGPLHYLIIIEEIELLPQLFGAVLAPEAVRAEMDQPETPREVRRWIAAPPPWLAIRSVTGSSTHKKSRTPALDEGETEALALAELLKADLILMDDHAGVTAARAEGFTMMGTLGVLDLAASRGLIDLADAFRRLNATNFRSRPELLDALLARRGTQK
jgi:predicted nucleic acid-binding protein